MRMPPQGSPPASQSVLALDKEGLSKRQAELETVIGSLPGSLKTELSTQLDSVKEKLKDPRQPGARLDSATAGVKKATARREKAEETLKQAQEALEQARLQETRAIQELEAAAAPPPPPETPPPGSVSLSSDDVAGLIKFSFFQELAEEREAAPGAEPPSKKGRVGPYGETPSLKATKDAAVRAKLERGQAYLGFMLNQSLKSGDGSCQAATQETPSQKGSGKGSGVAPGVGADPPKDPVPPPTPVAEKEKEATQPTRRQCDAGCSGQVVSPLLRGCGGLIWICSFMCLLAQMWFNVTFAACQTEPITRGTWSSCEAAMTVLGVPSLLDAAACKPECSTQCPAFERVNAFQKTPLWSPLPRSWAPTPCSTKVIQNRHHNCQLPGSMIIRKTSSAVDVTLHMTRNLVVCQAQTGHHHAPSLGRMPGILAHDHSCLCACQGQVEHAPLWCLKLPGSCHLHGVLSQGGSIGPCDHRPFSEKQPR